MGYWLVQRREPDPTQVNHSQWNFTQGLYLWALKESHLLRSCSDTELLRSGVAQICCCSDLELLRYGVTSGKTLPENESHPERWQRGYKFWSHALTHIKLYLSYPWTRQAHEAIRFIFAKPSWVGVSVAYNQTLLSDSGENFIQTTKEGSQEGQLQNLDIWNIRSQTKKINSHKHRCKVLQLGLSDKFWLGTCAILWDREPLRDAVPPTDLEDLGGADLWRGWQNPCVLCLVAQSCRTLCKPMDCSQPDSSVHGDSPGKSTGVGCHALLQGIFPTQGSNPGLPHCRRTLYHLSQQAESLPESFAYGGSWIFSLILSGHSKQAWTFLCLWPYHSSSYHARPFCYSTFSP